jgi:acid phosphatase (class A)
MNTLRPIGFAPLVMLLAACAAAPSPDAATSTGNASPMATTGSQMPSPATLPGYLAPGTFDILAVLPPAPRAGDARYEHDRRVFRETRALEGSPRWAMAANDAELGNAALLQHFSCSLGLELEPGQAPRLITLLQRVSRDTSAAAGVAKQHYQRQRPFWIDAGNTCRPREELGNSFDYPSGHTTAGWTWGIVCGVHNASAVQGGQLTATAVVTVAATTTAYQQDLLAARTELAALRSAPHAEPAAARCATEAALEKIP